MHLSKAGALVSILLMMSACQEIYQIKVFGEPFAPVFESEKPLYFGAGASISLSEYDWQTNKTVQVWLIERAQGAKAAFVSRVKYGELPDGFVALTATKPLKPEVVYVAYFSAGGGTSALGHFKILYDGTTSKLVNVDSRGEPKQ